MTRAMHFSVGFFAQETSLLDTKLQRKYIMDVCSLYPYVLKTSAFPYGHPDIYIGEESSKLIGKVPNINFDSVEGLVRCKVLPLHNLFHPIFPYRVKGFSPCVRAVAKHSCRQRVLTIIPKNVNSKISKYSENYTKCNSHRERLFCDEREWSLTVRSQYTAEWIIRRIIHFYN